MDNVLRSDRLKKLKFHYDMELSFDAPVTEHHYLFRFLPMEDGRQKCYNLQYGIEPSGRVCEMTDGLGNRVCTGEAMETHDSLRVWARGTVFVDRGRKVKEELHPMYCFQSDYTRENRELKEYLEKCVTEGGGTKYFEAAKDGCGLDLAVHLMNCLYRDFSYQPGATDVKTTAAQAWEKKAGVCQDYAHIFLCMCRMAGLGARYVAGMMAGEGASHAWTEVYACGVWTGFDPTNNCLADDNYIKLSHGRDFGDCSIDKGCFKGFAAQRQNIYVKVDECYG